MASRIQKKNRTKKSPRNLAGAVLSLPALKYGDSRTFFIEITMFQLAREVLTLVPDDYDDVSANISNPINYNLDETQIPEKLESKHSWLIDLQDGEHCFEAKTEEELWNKLRQAIKVKQKGLTKWHY